MAHQPNVMRHSHRGREDTAFQPKPPSTRRRNVEIENQRREVVTTIAVQGVVEDGIGLARAAVMCTSFLCIRRWVIQPPHHVRTIAEHQLWGSFASCTLSCWKRASVLNIERIPQSARTRWKSLSWKTIGSISDCNADCHLCFQILPTSEETWGTAAPAITACRLGCHSTIIHCLLPRVVHRIFTLSWNPTNCGRKAVGEQVIRPSWSW